MFFVSTKGAIFRKELKRTREIIGVLRKNGLGFLLVKTTLSKNKADTLTKEDLSDIGERLKRTCEQLGPTFVKMGQILSTRTEIVPEKIADKLKTLQDSVSPFSFEQAKALIESELNGTIENMFDNFNSTPIAAASMSQVYSAFLKSGFKVAIKVQRPNIKPLIKTDLEIISKLADFATKHTKYGKTYDLKGMVSEFKAAMELELDFMKEAENTDKFRENIANHKLNATVPQIKWIYTTKKIITMEFVEGIKIDNIKKLDEVGANKKSIATTLCSSLLKQILEDGFYHCDPHPGNLFVQKNDRLMFIDIGLMGKVSPRLKKNLTDMLIGITTQNTRKAAAAIMAMDEARANVNIKHFERTLDDLMNEFLYIPLKDINIANAFISIFDLASRYEMKIPREFAMIAKCLGTAQGVIDSLDNSVNIISIAKENVKGLSIHYLTSGEFKGDVMSYITDNVEMAKELPSFLLNFMKKAQENDFSVDLNLKKVEKIEKNVERMVDRVSFSVILLAVCIVIAGLVVSMGLNQGSLAAEVQDFTVIGLRLGVFIAAIIVISIVVSIINSERNKNKK